MEVFGNSGSRETVSSFLEGVFYNIYYYSSMTGGGGMGLCYVDMSYFVIDTVQGIIILLMSMILTDMMNHNLYLPSLYSISVFGVYFSLLLELATRCLVV